MSDEKQTVDEAILAELKALREEVKLLREQAKQTIVITPGQPYSVPYPVYPHGGYYQWWGVNPPWHTYGGIANGYTFTCGTNEYSGPQRGTFSAGICYSLPEEFNK